ncbi:hypothetical protein COEREDRAFT_83584 [Coemansia reversa NRRL 1564]|uniref:Uncharacterized protein n=1 Tax=Coemansia reversa (strain ATCC 12441 / NRRL 1564) TaxID=763665 RepID=A0A2G5B3K1_COERN|nr:hypothetical protein COEREDRAFT_83584 [Coemansia reversa NRRL 1564]|eukprot:PIA13287.1 hypothetical protein COEREDRAFT_83584 [Coemansia reversa NRRL 1564]
MSVIPNPVTSSSDNNTVSVSAVFCGRSTSDTTAMRLEEVTEIPDSPDSSCGSSKSMVFANSSTLGVGSNSSSQPTLLFSVPELSPTVGAELSPNDPLTSTPVGTHLLWSSSICTKHNGGHSIAYVDPGGVCRGLIDPVQVLKSRDLPDLSNGLPESVLHQMWALIGGLSDDGSTEFGALNLVAHRVSNAKSASYTADIMSGGLKSSGKSADKPLNVKKKLLPPANRVLRMLTHVAQRYRLREPAETLLAMLRQSLVDADMNMRVRQFWATLEGGNASDFVLLAHLTVAAREAQLSSKINLRHPQHFLETTCFEAARGEWDSGRVEASTGEVYGLLMLSEYGYQTGRNAVLWEFANNAFDTARRIVFRHTRYPWHGARLTQEDTNCDIEYEHMLCCYWSAWVRLLTAAQTTMNRIGASLYSLHKNDDSSNGNTRLLPEFTTHDMCHFNALPLARIGKTVPSFVEFPPTICRHQPHLAYTSSMLQCSLMVAEMHDRHIDLLERRITPVAFLDTLRRWDHRMCRWRTWWPSQWEIQMAELLEAARCINSSSSDNRLLIDSAIIHRGDSVGQCNQSRSSFSGTITSGASSEIMHIGSHLFHQTQMTAADTWLTILAAMYETARLRMHRIALALLRRRLAQSTTKQYYQTTGVRQLPQAAVALQFDELLNKLPDSILQAGGDIMQDEMEYHRCQFVSLEAARTLQTLFTTVELLSCSVERLGIWGVFILEHIIGLQCSRLHTCITREDQMDALCRLAKLLKQLLSLKRWSSALYVFTGIVKAFVDHSCIIMVDNCNVPDNSPWPDNHVLTLLMAQMNMDPKIFCAFTLPVVFASIASSSTPMPVDMRMRIASLLS